MPTLSGLQSQTLDSIVVNGQDIEQVTNTLQNKLDTIPDPDENDHTKVITVDSSGNYVLGEGASANYDSLVPNGTVTASAIGGLDSGTDVSGLKGNSIISVIDQILFPVVNPTRTDGKITITNSFRNGDRFRVGATQNNTVKFTPDFGSYDLPTNDGQDYLGSITDVSFIMTTGAYYDISDSENVDAVVQEFSFSSNTTSLLSGTDDDEKYTAQTYPPPPHNGTKYTQAYNTIKLKCKARFGASPYTPKNSHGVDYEQASPAMPAAATIKEDENTRYSLYWARQDDGNGGDEENPTTPSTSLSTDARESNGLIFSFTFNETASIKHRLLIPASFHETLTNTKTWTIMEQVGSTTYTELSNLDQWTSSTTGESIGGGNDYTITEEIGGVTYYVLKHKTDVSVALGQLDEKNYKLKRSS